MIFDKISEINTLPIPEDVAKAVMDFIAANDLVTLPCGKYPILGDHFANVAEAETRPQVSSRMEFHGKYADIQCIICGNERFITTPMSAATITQAYSEEKDVGFVEADEYNTIDLDEGSFIFFAPGEPHGPGLATASGITKTKKVIFKISIN